MYLRMNIGKYAGQVREFPFIVGRDLLKSGAASDPNAEPVAVGAPATPPPVPPKKSGKASRTAGVK